MTRDPASDANMLLRIEGKFPMSEGEAYERLANLNGGGMDYIVYADDPGDSDNPIGFPHGFVEAPGPPGGLVIATPAGLAFSREFTVTRGDLNEDFCFSSGCGDDVDEVDVKVRFVQGVLAICVGTRIWSPAGLESTRGSGAVGADHCSGAGFGQSTSVLHQKAAGAGEFVGLPWDYPHRQLFAGEVGSGQFEGLRGFGVIVERRRRGIVSTNRKLVQRVGLEVFLRSARSVVINSHLAT